jgi:hypothetical protein
LRDFTTFFQERPKKRNISNETFGLQTQSEPFNLRSGLSDDVTPLDFATPFYTAREVKPPVPLFCHGFPPCSAAVPCRRALPPCPAAAVPCRRLAHAASGHPRPHAALGGGGAACSSRARGMQRAAAGGWRVCCCGRCVPRCLGWPRCVYARARGSLCAAMRRL